MDVDVQQYKEDGYLMLRGFFGEHEVDQVRDDAKRIFLSQMRHKVMTRPQQVDETEFEQDLYRYFKEDLAGFINCANQAHYLLSLHRLGTDERIISLLKECGLNSPVIGRSRPVESQGGNRLPRSSAIVASAIFMANCGSNP